MVTFSVESKLTTGYVISIIHLNFLKESSIIHTPVQSLDKSILKQNEYRTGTEFWIYCGKNQLVGFGNIKMDFTKRLLLSLHSSRESHLTDLIHFHYVVVFLYPSVAATFYATPAKGEHCTSSERVMAVDMGVEYYASSTIVRII